MNKKLIRLLSLALAAVMVFSLCACNGGTAEEETTTTIPYSDQAIKDGDVAKAELVAKFNKLMADTKASTEFEGINYWLDQSAGDCECENEYVKASFKTLADKITNNDFGLSTTDEENPASVKDIFPVMGSDKAGALDLADVRSAVITDNEEDTHYTIVLKINPETNPEQENSIYGKLYKISKDDEILAEFAKYKDFVTVEKYDATYEIGTIKVVVDKATDHVTKLELGRTAAIETEITGQGTLASVGTVPLKFKYYSTANYEITWPAAEEAAE